MFGLNFNIFTSKTFWGALVGAAGIIVQNGPTKPALLQAGGVLLGALGIRDAIGRLLGGK